jgi:Recombinase
MNEKAEQGIWPSFAPLGYLNITGDDGKKIIIPDKNNAQFIVQLYEWYGSGKYSIKELAKMAKESGMIFRKSKNPVNKSTIQKILRNRIFTWVSLNGTNKFTRETINRLFLLNYGSNANKSYLVVTACVLKALNINLHSVG